MNATTWNEPMHVDELATPAALIGASRLARNFACMQPSARSRRKHFEKDRIARVLARRDVASRRT